MATKKGTNKKNGIFSRIYQGRILPYTFFTKYGVLVAGIIVFCIVITASKFHTMIQQSKIISLKTELNYCKSELVKATGEYNSKIREKFMLEKVDTLHLGLEMPEKPPYVLK